MIFLIISHLFLSFFLYIWTDIVQKKKRKQILHIIIYTYITYRFFPEPLISDYSLKSKS